MKILRIIVSDFFGLARVCGWWLAFRWLFSVVRHFKACKRAHNLQPADRGLGIGPFRCRLGNSSALLYGDGAISGCRELWVRQVYLADGFLTIPPNGKVVDLGANMGNFTLLALGHGPQVTAVSVEACEEPLAKLRAAVEVNHWQDRVKICHRFIGGQTEVQGQIASANGQVVPFITEQEFLDTYGIDQIDLLKCDIEGSEFELLKPKSLLLTRSRQLAIELHSWAGDMNAFVRMLADEGFETRIVRASPDDCIVQARRPGVVAGNA